MLRLNWTEQAQGTLEVKSMMNHAPECMGSNQQASDQKSSTLPLSVWTTAPTSTLPLSVWTTAPTITLPLSVWTTAPTITLPLSVWTTAPTITLPLSVWTTAPTITLPLSVWTTAPTITLPLSVWTTAPTSLRRDVIWSCYGTPDFTPFGEFMISPIRYFSLYILLNLSVLGLCLQIKDSGLFAWISLTALSQTYFFNS